MVGLVIRNGKIVTSEGIVSGDLSIEAGRICQVAISGVPKGDLEIDARGKIVMPGAIDAHAHLYDKKLSGREDFASGSSAAAAGGVTSVIVMPLDTPFLSKQSIDEAISEGCRKSLVDFALHAGNMDAESIPKVPEMRTLGITSFKAFTCDPYQMSSESIEKLMCFVEVIGGVTFVHAEDQKTLAKTAKKILKENRKDLLAHADSRTSEAEEKAIKKVAALSKSTGCRLHIAHVTSRQGCGAIAKAKKKKVPVSAETCPHYLVFTREDIENLGPYLKTNPSLKTSRDRAALWTALDKGVIDIVATDHAPATKEEKEAGREDIWRAPSGVPGVETLLPLMLSEGVNKGRLTLEQLVNALCAKPAQLFGLYPRKGVIQEGSDADLTIVDLKRETAISADKLHYKVGWTPYEGMKVKGFPAMTILRGMVVAEEGTVVGSPGCGQFLAR